MNEFEKEYLESIIADDHVRMIRALTKATNDELKQLSYKMHRNALLIVDYMDKTRHLRRG